jgi:hypothetical protein
MTIGFGVESHDLSREMTVRAAAAARVKAIYGDRKSRLLHVRPTPLQPDSLTVQRKGLGIWRELVGREVPFR